MEEWCKSNDIPLTEDQVIASRFCQSRGLRFLCEFGWDNAIAKADELFQREVEKIRIQ
jgi:hypothetical protein